MAIRVRPYRVKQYVTAVAGGGTGNLTLGSALSAALRGFEDTVATTVRVAYEMLQGSAWERGEGYPVSGTPWTFVRDVCFESSAGVGVKASFSAGAVVYCGPIPEDLADLDTRGRHMLPIPGGAFTPNTTAGPSTAKLETATNKLMFPTADFDASTPEGMQALFVLPPSWDGGTLTAVIHWEHPATTTNFKVSWGVSMAARGDGEALDLAFGTEVYTNDTGGSTEYEYRSPETAAITPSGSPQALDLLSIRIRRKADDATNDTLAVDAKVTMVEIYYKTKLSVD